METKDKCPTENIVYKERFYNKPEDEDRILESLESLEEKISKQKDQASKTSIFDVFLNSFTFIFGLYIVVFAFLSCKDCYD